MPASHELVEKVTKEKWNSLAIFLLIDAIQILFVSILSLDSNSLFIVGFDLTRTNTFLSTSLFLLILFVQLVIVYYNAVGMMLRNDVIQLYPQFKKPMVWECKYGRDEIVKWTFEMAEKSKLTIDRVYLLNSPVPNAFTFSLPGIGSVVFLHSNLLDLLNPDEVRAVVTHELAHIKNRDSIVQLLSRMPEFFVQVVYLYIYIRLILGIIDALVISFTLMAVVVRAVVFLLFFIVSRVVFVTGIWFVRKASRAVELLADFHAAQILGPEVTINALVRLGQRIEAVEALISEVKWLDSLNKTKMMRITDEELRRAVLSLDLQELDATSARSRAPEIFLTNRLRLLRDTYGLALSNKDIETAIKPATTKLLELREKTLQELKRSQTVNWRIADVNGDKRFSTNELKQLIQILRENPSSMMFDSESEKPLLQLDHPNFRRRVLFLADVLGL